MITAMLITVLLVGGYLAVVQSVAEHAYSRRVIPLLSIVVLIIYLCAVGAMLLLYFFYGNDPFIIYSALVLFAFCAVALLVMKCIKNADTMNWTMFFIFLAYAALVAYVTIFVRVGTVNTSIRMEPFERLIKAFETGSFEAMEHDVLNMLMFVPLGGLIPLLNTKVFQKLGDACLFGLIASTTIETTQLIAQLGQCDINDIIANTLGAVVGCFVVKLMLRIGKNWRL